MATSTEIALSHRTHSAGRPDALSFHVPDTARLRRMPPYLKNEQNMWQAEMVCLQ